VSQTPWTIKRREAVTLAAAIVLLVAVLFAGWGELLLGRRILFFEDIALYFVPQLDVQRAELLHGRIALWDPYVLCGKPFVGNPQAWPLYPSSLLLYVLSAEVATGVIGALHLLWAALGTLLFLRRRGLSRGGALLGAVVWGFGGALVSKIQFPNMVQAASYLPWLLWGIEGVVAAAHARGARAAVLGLIVGLSLFAAHPQITLMAAYVCAAWAVWRLRDMARNEKSAVLGCLAGAALLGGLLAAAQLLPVVELARVSVRPDLTLAKANRFILPPYAALYNFLLPNFYGNPASDDPYIARGNFWEPCAYMGILPFGLAIGAMFRLWKPRAEVRFWTVSAILCVWLAVGRDAGLFAAAFRILPGLYRFHDAARWLIPGTFALACLAAHGADSVLASLPTVPRRAFLGGVLIVASAIDLLCFVRTLNPLAPPDLFAEARVPLAGVRGRIMHADEGRVWGRWVSYRTYDVVRGEEARAFIRSRGPNLSALARQRQADGYEPVARADAWAFSRAVREGTMAKPRSPYREAAGVAAVVRLAGTDAAPVYDKHGMAGTRAQLWSAWEVVPTRQNALKRVLHHSWRGTPVVAGTGRTPPLTESQGRKAADTPVQDTTNQEADVLLPEGHKGGLLVLADTCHPGWKATLDSAEVPVLAVNGPFRGVFVAPGVRQVTFTYQPDAWRVGMFISLVASGILSAVFAAQAARGRLPVSTSPGGDRRALPVPVTKP
jgi:hypothetical protein